MNRLEEAIIDSKNRKYREVSVDGCKRIGKGAKADVYRYDDELIVKVYNEKNTYSDVEREILLARTAFVMGLPTAISFGIVTVGKGFGAMFELIDAKTFSELIAKDPDHVEDYAKLMAGLAQKIHAVSQDEKHDYFPKAEGDILYWINSAFPDEDDETRKRLMKLAEEIPPTDHLVHGDFHTGNVFLSGGEPLFIDVDRMAVGNPILDISAVYLFYIGFSEVDKKIIEEFMGFPYQTAERFYKCFIRNYLKTNDEEKIQAADQKAKLLGLTRLIGQIRAKVIISEQADDVIERLSGEVKELLDKTDSLAI